MSDLVKRYAPDIYQDNDTMKSLYEVQSQEMDKVKVNINSVFNNNFVETADTNGIRKMEKLLEMKDISNDDDLETRKENVRNKLVFRPSYTKKRFEMLLNSLFGEGGYYLDMSYDNYQIIIDVDMVGDNYFKFQRILRDIIPANVELIFSVQYTYMFLKKNFSYEQMENYTYMDLSRYSGSYKKYTNLYLLDNFDHDKMSNFNHGTLSMYK